MAGRKRRKIAALAKINNNDQRVLSEKKESEERQTWAELPTELLEQIMSLLALKDNICASAVCKKWLSVAISVQVVKQIPWLMYFPKFGNLYELYDPSERKTYSLELPELYGARVCYARDGWLLLYRARSHSLFFFNPFTRGQIKLPTYEMSYQIVAFSCAPTSPGCIVFTVKHINPAVVAISTCSPGATEWTTLNYHNRLPFVSSIWNKMVFCNGLFYCLSLTGWLGVFNPCEQTWVIRIVPPPKCPENFFSKNWWKGKFMVEHNGDVFVVYTCRREKPIVFKLDQTNRVWEEVSTLNGATLFASFLSSHSRSDLLGPMRNRIYFSKVRFYGRRCVSYSLDDCRYYPRKQCHDWGEQDPFESIWIDPPEDLSTLT